MKIFVRSGLALTLFALTAGSSLAGEVGRAPGPAQAPSTPPSISMPRTADRELWVEEVNRQAMMPSKARWERARRAAVLVNANRCQDAYKLAVGEKDNKLAEGVVRACTPPAS